MERKIIENLFQFNLKSGYYRYATLLTNIMGLTSQLKTEITHYDILCQFAFIRICINFKLCIYLISFLY